MKAAQANQVKEYNVVKNDNWVMSTANPAEQFVYRCNHELQDCYAAFDEFEYFAQCCNAYLGANGGTDPYTRRPRHNGEQWLRANEDPALMRLLDELFSAGPTNAYAKANLNDTNTADTGADDFTVADYIKTRVAIVKTQKRNIDLGLTDALARRRAAMFYDD